MHGVAARRSIGVALVLIGGLLGAFFALQVVFAWQEHERARDIVVADRVSKNIVQAITDLGVVRGFTMTYLIRPDATRPEDIAELTRRFRTGSNLLDAIRADLSAFRPDLVARLDGTAERARTGWGRAAQQLALDRAGRDAPFSEGWFAAYSAVIGELEALLVEVRSAERLQDAQAAFLNDLRIAILRWRLLRTREMGVVGARAATGAPGSPALVGEIDGLRFRADTLFAQVRLNVSTLASAPLLIAMQQVADALTPLNEAYERARAAWNAGRPAPISPVEHDQLTFAAIGSINRLIAAISDESQRHAAALERQALLRTLASFTLFAAGLALAFLSWRMVARAVIEPLEELSGVAQRVAAGDRAARAPARGAIEVREAAGQFNQMLDAMQRVQGDLERTNDALERGRQEIAARERRLKAITDNLPAFIAYLDRERRLQFVNTAAEQWLARPAAALMGMRADDVMADGPWPASANGSETSGEGCSTYPDGVKREVEFTLVPEVAADGAIAGHYVLAVDVTDRKRTEQQLRHSQRNEAIGQLTGGVAHDFNNLLAIIAGNLELLAESLDDRPELQRQARAAIRASERGATLTRSLLAFARQQALLPTVVDLNRLVGEMSDLLRRTLPENIAMRIAPGRDLWRCTADAGQLQNALLNLVVNARDAMDHGGSMTIETGNARLSEDYAAAHTEVSPGEYVMLAVSDSGVGMPPDVAARAFEPFFTTKEVGKGTGLGLSMVYGFAKQSGGHVNIYSEVGVGTTVKVYLPRALAAGDPLPEPEPLALPAAAAERILLVEDDREVLTLLDTLLGSLGYRVELASDGAAALRILAAHDDVALLLTDVVLPGEMNGPQLAERALALRPALRVVFMSGYTEHAVLQSGRIGSNARLLHKPFTKAQLAAALRTTLAGAPTRSAEQPGLLVVDDEAAFADFVRTVASAAGFGVRTAANGPEFHARYAERVPDVVVMDMVMPGTDGIELTRWLVDAGYGGRLIAVSGYNPQYLRAAQVFGELSGKINVTVLSKPVALADLRRVLLDAVAALRGV
ncbi:MAG: response regulator [Alphaproteobacteria bacterium]|nr:response regulator [Alphaproteobacteria bacterium]